MSSNTTNGKKIVNQGIQLDDLVKPVSDQLMIAPPFSNFIGDRIWLDSNGNGVQDANEAGMANVTVKLFNADGRFVAQTQSDANGEYRFQNVPFGQYKAQFIAPKGYVFTKQNATIDHSDSDANSSGFTDIIQIGPWSRHFDIDAGLVAKPVSQTGSIGNKVWLDSNQNGIQDAGEKGAAGVKVELMRALPTPLPGQNLVAPHPDFYKPVATTTTDANGHYNFKDVAEGSYQVRVSGPDGYSFSPVNVGNNDNKDSDANSNGVTGRINLSAGQKINNIDIGLVKKADKTSSVGDLVWLDANKNGIQDAGEKGMAGVTVELRKYIPTFYQLVDKPTQPYEDPSYTNMVVAKTVTDADGRYKFENVLPTEIRQGDMITLNGQYYLQFTAPNGYSYTQSLAGTNREVDSNANPYGRTSPFSLKEGESNLSQDVGLVKIESGSISGRAWSDFEFMGGDNLPTPGVQDAGERGLNNVAVAAYNAKGELVATTTTDANGNYRFANLADGDYKLHFAAQGHYADAYIAPQNRGGDDKIDSDINKQGYTNTISIKNGQAVTNVDAGYALNDALETFARVGNRVWHDLDQDGKQDLNEPGIAGVKVLAYNKAGNVVQSQKTDSQGNFLFKLEDGEYRFRFDTTSLDGAYRFSKKDSTHDAYDSDVNANGYTDLIKVNGGDLNVNVDAGVIGNGTPPQALGAITGRAWSDADMVMRDTPRNFGIQDAGESGLAKISVGLFDQKGQLVASTMTDDKGNYRFDKVKAGEYKLHFAPQGYATDVDPTVQNQGGNDKVDSDINKNGFTDGVIVKPGQVVSNVDAGYVMSDMLMPFARIGNRVWNDIDRDGKQDSNESGMGGIRVNAISRDGKTVASQITDKNGNFLFKLEQGEYRFQFESPQKAGFAFPYRFSPKDATNDVYDSDVSANGSSDWIKVKGSEFDLNLDAGMFNPVVMVDPILPRAQDILSDDQSLDQLLPAKPTVAAAPAQSVSIDAPQMSISTQLNKLFELEV